MAKYTIVYEEHWVSGKNNYGTYRMKHFDTTNKETDNDKIIRGFIEHHAVFKCAGWIEVRGEEDECNRTM